MENALPAAGPEPRLRGELQPDFSRPPRDRAHLGTRVSPWERRAGLGEPPILPAPPQEGCVLAPGVAALVCRSPY